MENYYKNNKKIIIDNSGQNITNYEGQIIAGCAYVNAIQIKKINNPDKNFEIENFNKIISDAFNFDKFNSSIETFNYGNQSMTNDGRETSQRIGKQAFKIKTITFNLGSNGFVCSGSSESEDSAYAKKLIEEGNMYHKEGVEKRYNHKKREKFQKAYKKYEQAARFGDENALKQVGNYYKLYIEPIL